MNKLLITTSIAALACVSAASAQIDAGIKGAYIFGVSYVDNEGDTAQSVQFGQDMEFEFNGKFEMDNGITVFGDLEVDLQGKSENLRTDDISFGFEGNFGKLTFGTFSNDKITMVPTPSTQGMDGAYKVREVDVINFDRLDDTDGNAIVYKTPSIAGFAAQIGYRTDGEGATTDTTTTAAVTPDCSVGQTNIGLCTNSELGETAFVGFGYTGDFGGAKATVAGHYTQGIGGGVTADEEIILGASVSVDGFGARFAGFSFTDDSAASNADQATGYGGDLSYNTGPWKFTASYSREEQETADGDDTTTAYIGRVDYAFGPGVTLSAYTANTKLDDASASGADNDEATQYTLETKIAF